MLDIKELNVKALGEVAVLMGGSSAERAISLKSGMQVFDALMAAGVSATAIDVKTIGPELVQQLKPFDRVFIALHGRGGEDGTLQGFLEIIGMPYTGSGVMGSAIAMDKVRSKQIWMGASLPTADFKVIRSEQDLADVEKALAMPLIIKPSREGSSIGMSKVNDSQSLKTAYEVAGELDKEILAEKWVQGAEYTVGILGDEALPIIRLETPRDFYDYDAKYNLDSTLYHCPCGLSEKMEEEIKQLSLEAFQILGCSGWGRVDLMMDEGGEIYFLEANTVPGMTDHSLVPMAANAAGYDFQQLVLRILQLTL